MLRIIRELPALGLMAFLLPLSAAESTQPVGQVDAPTLFKEIGDGIFVMGNVQIDSKTRQITFPATVNMQSGLLEYLLVTNNGKAHESLLITEIEPYHLHAAMLLLGVKDTQQQIPSEALPSAIDKNVLAKLPEIEGNLIQVSLLWNQNGKKHELPAESWILKESGEPVSKGPWT